MVNTIVCSWIFVAYVVVMRHFLKILLEYWGEIFRISRKSSSNFFLLEVVSGSWTTQRSPVLKELTLTLTLNFLENLEDKIPLYIDISILFSYIHIMKNCPQAQGHNHKELSASTRSTRMQRDFWFFNTTVTTLVFYHFSGNIFSKCCFNFQMNV